MENKNSICEKLILFISKKFELNLDTFDKKSSLFFDGLLDSFEHFTLMHEIEGLYNIRISEHEMESNRLDTIENISEFIMHKRAALNE